MSPPQGWGFNWFRTCERILTTHLNIISVLHVGTEHGGKRKFYCVHTGDSPKNLAPGVRLSIIYIGKSPPMPGRGEVGHFIDTRIIGASDTIITYYNIAIYVYMQYTKGFN